MTNHLGAQTLESEGSPAVIIELPNGSTEKIAVGDKDATVRCLKVACELQFGIPCNLQQVSSLENPGIELKDWSPLTEAVQTMDDVIVVQVPVWWNKFICVSLNNEIENVCRRAKLQMQQISKEERLFVGCFIACCRGHENLLEKLKTLGIELDQHAATEAGRNLFHAAAASGKANCVKFVAEHFIKPTKEMLTMLDTNRETPLDIARRLNHHDTERLLYKYIYHEKGDREERCSAESGIDVGEDCDLVDDDSSEERKAENEKVAQEDIGKLCGNSNAVVEELVITECDEGLTFAIDMKLSQLDTPPNLRKSEAGVIQRDSVSLVDNNSNQERVSSPSSSDSSDESSSLSPVLKRPQTINLALNQHHLRRRFVRPKSARTALRYPQINVHQEDKEDDGTNDRLPPLESQMLVNQTRGNLPSSSASSGQLKKLTQAVVRTQSMPNCGHAPKQRLTPTTDDEKPVIKSAPGSPQSPRRVFKPSVKPASLGNSFRTMSPKVSAQVLDGRRGSEPLASLAPQQRPSPTPDDEKPVTKSAPGSPQSPRLLFKPSVKPPPLGNSVTPMSPISARVLDRRRGSEPFACLNRTSGVRLGRVRRDAVITADVQHGDNYIGSPMMPKRGKARSICEVSLMESLRCLKDVDEEERLDRPWNAWIAVRKESIQHGSAENISQSPTNPRRKSYQQWLSEKELSHLRNIFANAQEAAKTNEKQAKLLKGKTFDEWLEDKRKEMEREREKEKGMEENHKVEEDKKHQRRRMSQAKYDKWLMQKEWSALHMEEKMEQEAKHKHEILKKKWEEEDEQKKNGKPPAGRTHSLPVEGTNRVTINKHRFTSLK